MYLIVISSVSYESKEQLPVPVSQVYTSFGINDSICKLVKLGMHCVTGGLLLSGVGFFFAAYQSPWLPGMLPRTPGPA